MVMLAGGFYLAQRTPGVAQMLIENEHCGFYDDAASCIGKCGEFLRDPARREEIRIQGERFVRAHHTYDQRVTNILGNRAFTNPLSAS
jgi:spore maturation protein CgeB